MGIKTNKIQNAIQELGKTIDTRSPEAAIEALNISLLECDLGTRSTDCKGFYYRPLGNDVIAVNNALDEEFRRVVLAHELGHAVLHRREASAMPFQDWDICNTSSPEEYEANMFAAEFLLSDADVMAAIRTEGMSFFLAAKQLNVPPEILDFKFRMLSSKGYSVKAPMYAKSDFLKDYKQEGNFR